jgi:hypothetical protein
MGKMRNAYKILVRKPEVMRPLIRPRHRWERILAWLLGKYIKEIGRKGVD